MKKFNRIIAVLIALSIIFSATAFAFESDGFDYLEYPNEAISVFSEDILNCIGKEEGYEANKGYDGTALYFSPYWSLTVNNESVPLYATLSYDRECDGVLSSYQYIFPKGDSFTFNVSLKFNGEIYNGICLPEKEGVAVEIMGDTLNAVINHCGTFTFLINNDDQRYAVTLFVKEYTNESAEIANYINTYGEDNVTIIEKGYYELDELVLDRKVTYFCKGAFIKANHIKDINSADDEGKLLSFMYVNGGDGVVVDGLGTFDFNSLDWHERSHFTVNESKNSNFEGLIFLNPSSWTVTFYGCENCNISDISVFGYRTNSDGINVCGCSDMAITDCFCRNGDDSFSVKTTNSVYPSKNIKFSNCIGWSTKARCFGITGEVYAEISDIEFSDCAVIYRNAIWDNDRVSSLAVMNEYGGCNISNVTFRNIEIHHDSGRPIIVAIWNDAFPEDVESSTISNIVFQNIDCKYSAEMSKLSAQRDITKFGAFAAKICTYLVENGYTKVEIFQLIVNWLSFFYDTDYSIGVDFSNVTVNGRAFTKSNDIVRVGNTSIG